MFDVKLDSTVGRGRTGVRRGRGCILGHECTVGRSQRYALAVVNLGHNS